jgi:hypothetical protein
MHLLVGVKQRLSIQTGRASLDYGEVAELVLGRAGRFFINMFLLITQFGFCCVYVWIKLAPSRQPPFPSQALIRFQYI